MSVYTFEDHTGEVRLLLGGGTLEELFADAGRALAELLAGELPRGAPVAPIPVELVARDLRRLLADWIDELVYRSETGRLVLERFEPLRVTEAGALSAVAHGHAMEEVRTAVKAATLHGLRVDRTDGGWSAAVVLDV